MGKPKSILNYKRRGNANWGKKLLAPIPVIPTAFEEEVKRLRLETFEQQMRSPTLKLWIQRHCNTRYVPEKLLEALNIRVLSDDHGSLIIG